MSHKVTIERSLIYSSTGVFDSTGLTIEQNAYYPFGARHSYGSRWLTQDPLAQKEIILYFMLIQMEGLDVASALIPGLTAPMTKVAVKGTENITGVGKFVDNTGLDKAFGGKSDEYTNLIIEISEES